MSVYVPADLRRRVRAYFGGICAYCRTAEHLTVAIFEIEHIVPRSSDGETLFENLCFACPTCNRYKGDRTTAAMPGTHTQVRLFHPLQDAWPDHFAWSADSSEVLSATDRGKATIAALRMNRPQLVRLRRLWVTLGEHPPEF